MLRRAIKWGDVWKVGLLLCLQCLSFSQGDVYREARLKEVTTFSSPVNTICVSQIEHKPKLALKIHLKTRSKTYNEVSTSSDVFIKNKLLQPLYSERSITMEHVVEGRRHVLKVLLDGKELAATTRYEAWSDDYDFDHIALQLKGTAEIIPCENPITTTITTTSTTTTTTSTTTTTAAPTTPPPTTTPRPPPPTTTTTTTKATTMPEATVSVAPTGNKPIIMRDNDVAMESNITDLVTVNTTNSGTNGEEEAPTDEEPWWNFIYILGDFKSIPNLILLLIAFVVGLGIGSVTTILCEQYCPCCENRDDDDDDDDPKESELAAMSRFRYDYNKPLENSNYASPCDPQRITKASISNPIFSGSSYTPQSPGTYSMPYGTNRNRNDREHYMSSSTDETLPLNSPLPRENQTPNSGSYSNFNL